MIPDSRYPEIAEGLLRKTRQGEARWEPSQRGDKTFMLSLPQSAVYLSYDSPPTEPDYITLEFYNPDAMRVGTWTVQSEDEQWALLSELYEEVTRKITGWDKVLEDLEKFIGNGGSRAIKR